MIQTLSFLKPFNIGTRSRFVKRHGEGNDGESGIDGAARSAAGLE
jgi:hypothetical protein